MIKQLIPKNFSLLAQKIKDSDTISIVGNGGNLAIASHVSSDLSRYLGKFCFAPTAVHLTALGGDGSWHNNWICDYGSKSDLIIGITTRIDSPISKSLEKLNHNTFLISPVEHPNIKTMVVMGETYHEFEVNTLWQFYMLYKECGAVLKKISY